MGRVVAVLVLGIAGAGCVERCVSGESNACACTDGRAGTQVCNALGSFEPCECTSPPDAGVADAGPLCLSRNPLTVELNPPLRLAVGAGATVFATTFSAAPRTQWTLIGEAVDGGLFGAGATSVSVQFDRPGTWWLEAEVTSASNGDCRVGRGRGGALEVVPTSTLPFVVVDAACCDVDGHAYVVSDAPPTLWRLDGDQVSSQTLLARRPRKLALSDDGSLLFVGQDGFVSTYLVPSLTPQWELPFSGIVDAVAGDTRWAWLFSDADATRLELATGTLTAQTFFNQWSSSRITGAFLVGDGGLVLDTNGFLSRVTVSAGALGRPRSTDAQSCGFLWAEPGGGRFFSACRESLEPAPDGGFTYRGLIDDGPMRLRAVGPSGDGRLAVVSGAEPSRPLSRFRFVSPQTFEPLASRDVGLWSAPDEGHLIPHWLVPQSDAGVRALTAAQNLGVTWVEIFP